MKKSAGFTLTELLIVVAIVSILSVVVSPMIGTWVQNYRLQGAARDVYGAAATAKGRSVRTNTNHVLSFGAGGNAYIVFEDDNANCELDAGEATILSRPAWPQDVRLDPAQGGGDGLTFTNNDDGNPTIAFRPNAIPTANGGGFANGTVFLINRNALVRSITINVAGNIRIN